MTDQSPLSAAPQASLDASLHAPLEVEVEQPPLAAAPAEAGVKIGDLVAGQTLTTILAVRERELRQKRNGEPFLKLMLGDSSGTVEAVAWEDAETLYGLAQPGSALHVAGVFEQSDRWGSKIKLTGLRVAAADEFDAADLAAGPAVEADRLTADLRDLIETIQHPQLRELLDRILGEASPTWARFREAPAAKHYHQAYRHGLLEHTLSVAQAVSAAAAYFPGIDRDVAVTGAILHDIGKTQAYNDDPLAIDLTDLGRLQGEIPLGYYLVRRQIEEIDGFDPALAQHVLHIVLSHHGALEHGSPVVPATREASLVHALDNLGGKLGSFDRLERALPEGESWSRYDRAIEGSAFFASRAA
ncbi:MAG: 3-5 exoribonuclease [Solirubrobacterales bacterium]|nr:3-5 exoribonuclease [Solirubrobacterales bacterium]